MSDINEAAKQVVKKPKVGTPKTEAIIGSAAVKLNAGVENLKKVFEQVDKLPGIIQELSLKVADYEDKITSLDQQYTNTRAQKEFELKLAFEASKEAYVNSYLSQNGLVKLDSTKYTGTLTELQGLKSEFHAKLTSEVTSAKLSLTKDFENSLALEKAKFNVQEAENKAKINELQARLEMAMETAEGYKAQLNAERSASVERSKASAVGTISVGQNK